MLDSIVLNFQSAPKTTERALEMVSRSLSYRDYQNFHFKHEKNFFNFAGKSRFSCDVKKYFVGNLELINCTVSATISNYCDSRFFTRALLLYQRSPPRRCFALSQQFIRRSTLVVPCLWWCGDFLEKKRSSANYWQLTRKT
jgi:hypothetical protein